MKLIFINLLSMNSRTGPFQGAHPILKTVAFIFIMLLSASMFTALGMLVASLVAGVPMSENILTLSSNTDSLIIIQIISAIGIFIVPVFAILAAFWVTLNQEVPSVYLMVFMALRGITLAMAYPKLLKTF